MLAPSPPRSRDTMTPRRRCSLSAAHASAGNRDAASTSIALLAAITATARARVERSPAVKWAFLKIEGASMKTDLFYALILLSPYAKKGNNAQHSLHKIVKHSLQGVV